MLGLSYLLNAGLDSEMSSYCVGAMIKINRALDKHRRKIRLDKISRPRLAVDAAMELLEMFYFNEKQIGLVLEAQESDSREEVYRPKGRIIYLTEEDIFVNEEVVEQNRTIWWKYLRTLIAQGPQTGPQKLKRPHSWIPLSYAEELQLACELSEVLQERGEGKLLRAPGGVWYLDYQDQGNN